MLLRPHLPKSCDNTEPTSSHMPKMTDKRELVERLRTELAGFATTCKQKTLKPLGKV